MIVAIGAGHFSDFWVEHLVIPEGMNLRKEAQEWDAGREKSVLINVPVLESFKTPITEKLVEEWHLNGWPPEMVKFRKAIEQCLADHAYVPKTKVWRMVEGHQKSFKEWLIEKGAREATQEEMPYFHQDDLLDDAEGQQKTEL